MWFWRNKQGLNLFKCLRFGHTRGKLQYISLRGFRESAVPLRSYMGVPDNVNGTPVSSEQDTGIQPNNQETKWTPVDMSDTWCWLLASKHEAIIRPQFVEILISMMEEMQHFFPELWSYYVVPHKLATDCGNVLPPFANHMTVDN